jgi:hypothetical protein
MIIIIVITIFIPACSTNKVDVKLKLKQGDMFQVEDNFEKDIINDIKELTELNKIKKTINYGAFVKTIDERKNIEFIVTINAISTSITMNENEIIQYSSEFSKVEDNEVSKILSYLVDKSFVVYLRQDGKVDEIVGLDESIKDGIENVEFNSQEQKEKISQLIYQEFGKDQLMNKIDNINILYRDESVKKGQKWGAEGEIKEVVDFDVKGQFELMEISDDNFKVNRKSELITNEELSKTIINNTAYQFDLKAKEESEVYLDKNTALIKKLSSFYEGVGIVKVTSNNPDEGAKEYPIEIKVKTNLSISK